MILQVSAVAQLPTFVEVQTGVAQLLLPRCVGEVSTVLDIQNLGPVFVRLDGTQTTYDTFEVYSVDSPGLYPSVFLGILQGNSNSLGIWIVGRRYVYVVRKSGTGTSSGFLIARSSVSQQMSQPTYVVNELDQLRAENQVALARARAAEDMLEEVQGLLDEQRARTDRLRAENDVLQFEISALKSNTNRSTTTTTSYITTTGAALNLSTPPTRGPTLGPPCGVCGGTRTTVYLNSFGQIMWTCESCSSPTKPASVETAPVEVVVSTPETAPEILDSVRVVDMDD
jgi:hypothetical protein